MANYKEIAFEKEIAEYLADHGWLYSETDAGYDKARAIFPEDVLGWLEDTQPHELKKALKRGTAQERDQLLDRLTKVLDTPLDAGGGTLNVLRKGFAHIASRFDMCEFQPESTLNATTLERYAKVRLRVMRQVHFSVHDNRSLDLVLFVNGLPVATLELKTDFTQNIQDAIQQYKTDRMPKDRQGHAQPLFGFGNRALVHFALSNAEVWMTTKLDGPKTHFLPFNRGGSDGGAGNPPPDGDTSATAYLWEDILQRDNWLNILGKFLHVETSTSRDPISGKTSKSTRLLFPRYHQWDVVTRLTRAAASEGPGNRYLVQHSAGSGKTNSIAWTAHRLARLQVNNEKVFDSVIVITDRNVLDAQLQDAIKQIDTTAQKGQSYQGIVAAIDIDEARRQGASSKSGLLAKALLNGKLIIIVTIQTFPHAMDEIRQNASLRGKKFAVIADEAHSSQTGKTASDLKLVLTSEELAEAEASGEIDTETLLLAEAASRAESEDISYFAFTATPKAKTLELFGRVPEGDSAGLPAPFHVYSMKQAIEEGYILDVLRGYQSYQMAFNVGQAHQAAGAETVEVDQGKAAAQVKRWVKINPQTITQKAAIMVDHFHDNVAHLLEGHAKAMVVTDSRLAAVRYKRHIDEYIESKGYSMGTLVAFSGTLTDDEYGFDGLTEAAANPGVGDLRKAFDRDEFKLMIVANKFQTGFDQPLLCAMYVDRRLSGVTTVQTLSRLNRTYRTPSGQLKNVTLVVDFVNEPAAIQADFEPYYTDAFLETETDPNLVHNIAAKLDMLGVYEEAEIDRLVEVWLANKGNNALEGALGPVAHRYLQRREQALAKGDKEQIDELAMFVKDLGTFVRVYDFMSQIINYGSVALEKRAIFYRLLSRRIADPSDTSEIDLSGLVLNQIRLTDRGKTDLSLGSGDAGLHGTTAAGSGQKHDPKMGPLQDVIDILNTLFSADEVTPDQNSNLVSSLMSRLMENSKLVQQAKANAVSRFAESPDFDRAVADAAEDNVHAHELLIDFIWSNSEKRAEFISKLAKAFHGQAGDAA